MIDINKIMNMMINGDRSIPNFQITSTFYFFFFFIIITLNLYLFNITNYFKEAKFYLFMISIFINDIK